jgi:hypothetical protein
MRKLRANIFTVIFGLVLISMTCTALTCTKSRASCKKDAKKVKQRQAGWKN